MNTLIGQIRSRTGEDLLKMFDVTVSSDTQSFPMDSNCQFEIALITSGNGSYQIGNTVHPINPGDFFVFFNNEPRSIASITTDSLSFLTLHFEPRFLFSSTLDTLSNSSINRCFIQSDAAKNRIPATHAQTFQTLFLQIQTELAQNKPEAALVVKSLLTIFFVTLIREHDFADPSHSFRHKNINVIHSAQDYINQHLAESITLSDVANAVHMSPSYLSSLFKDCFGVSLWNHIVTLRLEKAIALLLDNRKQYTILEIALQCGFNNTTNFNRAFRKHTGLTPSQYRSTKKDFI